MGFNSGFKGLIVLSSRIRKTGQAHNLCG